MLDFVRQEVRLWNWDEISTAQLSFVGDKMCVSYGLHGA